MSDEIRGSQELPRSDSADSPRDSNHRSRLSSPRPDSGREDGARRLVNDQQQRASLHGNLSAGLRSQSPSSIRSVSPHPAQSPARALSPSPSRSRSGEARNLYTGIHLSPGPSQECMNLDINRSRSPHPMEDREPYSSGYEEDHSEISSQHGRNTPSYRSKSPFHNPASQLRYSHESKMNGSSPSPSPRPDSERGYGRATATPSPALRGTPAQDFRSFLIEKEVLESQMRKMQVEMSSLQSENKLMRERYNRSQARVTELESQVADSQKEHDRLVEEFNNEIAALKRKTRSEQDVERQESNGKISSLTKECEMHKAENSSLEKQLDLSRKSGASNTKVQMDKIKTVEILRAELAAHKDQLAKIENLYQESERQRHDEAERRKEAAQHIVRLTEMKNMLQQQVESGSAGTVTEKQEEQFNAYAVKSLEKRLKVTEDRLQSERSDRAGKLSEVEEKLINDNAKLQVAEKELRRKWEREKNRTKNFEQRVRDLREENEAMSTALSNNIPTCYQALNEDGVIRRGNVPIKVPSYKKNSEEYKQLIRHIEKELGLRLGQEEEIVHTLWYKRDEAVKMLKEWELQLHHLKVDKNNIASNLRSLVLEKTKYDTRVLNLEDALADEKRHREEMEAALRTQVGNLVQDKHNHIAQIKTLEDRLAGIIAENEALRMNLGMSPSSSGKTPRRDPGAEAQVESLTAERDALSGQVQQQNRSLSHFEGEVQTLKAQLVSKTQQLEDAQEQINNSSPRLSHEMSDLHRQKVDKLKAEIQGLQAEVKHWQDKYNTVCAEKVQFEERVDHLNKQIELNQSKLERSAKSVHAAESQKLALENELSEKELQLIQVTAKYQESENELQRTKQLFLMEQETSTQLASELDSYQVQLDQKAGIIRQLSGTEHDNRHVVESLQQNLDAAQVDLTDRAIELHESKQDLAKEKTVSAQLKTEKLEVQQKLEAVADERDMYKREKDMLEYELEKRDSEVQMATRQMEEETRKIHSEKEDQVKNISTANKKVVLELEATKRQNEAKEREIGTLNENAVRLKDEIESQRKKVALLKEENIRCREDQQRLQEELTTRVKENSASVEVNQRLVNDKTALQMEKYQLQKDLDKEREILALKKEEVAELVRKLEKIDDQHRSVEKQVHEKENRIVALETELHHTNKSQNYLQSDHGQLKVQNDHLAEEVKNLSKTAATLEKQLETEKTVLRQERTNGDKLRDEVNLEQQRVQLLQTDYDLVLNNLDAERRSLDKVKEQCRLLEGKAAAEESRAEAFGTELDTVKAQLVVTRETADQHKEDKQNLFAELQEMCQKLEDKEALISHLQAKCDLQVERIQREMEQEKRSIHCDRESVEMHLLRVREENDDLKETVRQREIQVLANEKAIQDLECEMKARQELEVRQQQLQSELHDSKMLMGHMKTETVSQKETIKQLQENMDKLKEHNASLREKLHEQQDRLHGDVAELKQVYHDNHSKLEKDKNDYKDKLNKTTANLKAAEVALSNAAEAKEQLANSNKTLEKTAEMLKTQLHEEITNRKLAEQKIETVRLQLDDTKNKSTIFDDKVGFLQGQLAKAETELAMTREKMKKVMDDMNDLEATLFAQEARAQTLQEQVLALETENNSLHHQLEAKKIQQQGKNRRASLELKQQLENFEKDRAKYNQQSQQLCHDLEKARQQISDKNKENLRLNEELLQTEEKYRDTSGQLKQVQDSNKLEGSLQNKLNAKVHELETENAALRATLAQLTNGDDIDTRSIVENYKMTHELNRMVQDLNAQLMERLEAQRNTEKEAQQREEKYAKDNKSKLYDLESQLNTEKAMHIITKNQLTAVEDDNQKLRNRLIQAKKNMGAAERAKHMSRMEEINELIARSQSRAQAMLATGCMDDHAFSPRDFGRSLTPHSNIHSPVPNSDASDSLSLSAGLLHMNATNNNSVFRPI
ncbi:uncharacterized protein LOC135482562 isoform X2 [Lineus longissimus]|uniref:uncharacterized protein LOC135482562 isoform X2 n=1 Tax=Lineus longissimus TaxID=88925 RepID=UPI00315DFA26